MIFPNQENVRQKVHILHTSSNEQLLQDGTVEAKQAPIDLSVKLHGEVRLFSAGFHL